MKQIQYLLKWSYTWQNMPKEITDFLNQFPQWNSILKLLQPDPFKQELLLIHLKRRKLILLLMWRHSAIFWLTRPFFLLQLYLFSILLVIKIGLIELLNFKLLLAIMYISVWYMSVYGICQYTFYMVHMHYT